MITQIFFYDIHRDYMLNLKTTSMPTCLHNIDYQYQILRQNTNITAKQNANDFFLFPL